MDRKKLVRFELIVLAVVTLLLAYRVIEGPPSPQGIVVHDDLGPDRLVRQSFSIDEPLRVSIDAAGSFESPESRIALGAYGWIIRREDREIVWRMTPDRATRGRGTLALATDTLELSPGTYDAFFASYGNSRERSFGISFLDRLIGNESAWKSDGDRWRMIVRRANGQTARIHRLGSASEAELSPSGEGLIWSTAPMRGNRTSEHVFRVAREVPVRVYAVGEIENHQMDYGWIEDAVSHGRLWEMTLANTKPAGGWSVNRLFDDTIRLEPGIYRAVFETDPRQNFNDWVGNPPYDPAAWGMSLFTDQQEAVSDFDPWSSGEPIVSITEVGDSERHSAQFQVTSTAQLAVFALGEMGDSGRYDYAWIRNNDTQETVWEMTYERSQPAGGHNNRRELAFIEFSPGTYTVTYETDDSHSFDSWRHGRPDNPERWGVSVFSLAETTDTTAVRLLGYSEESMDEDGEAAIHVPHPPDAPPSAELPPLPGREVVDLTGLENETRVSSNMAFDSETLLHVRALGEISLSGRYDYGWIERAENGEIVWEMTWQNTHPAGGADKNRIFDGPIRLPAGRYVVHFKTDFSHAAGDFEGQEPHLPQAWGIRITRP